MIKIDFDNHTNFALNTEFLELLEKILERVLEISQSSLKTQNHTDSIESIESIKSIESRKSMNLAQNLPKITELILCDENEIKKINLEFRAKNESTDVLSFPLNADFGGLLGSIIISLPHAQNAAEKFSHSIENEIALLFMHGALHLCGFDHECDNGEQRAAESALVAEFNLPKSLIIRNDSINI